MDYKKYRISRDMAWKILLDQNIVELPVRVSEICKNMEIAVRSYRAGAETLQLLNLTERTKTADGFAVMLRDRPLIFYNEKCNSQRNRFTIAHELGHILLGHLPEATDGGVLVSGPSREPGDVGSCNPIENEANVFASRLLAPACVLWGIGVQGSADIERACDISRPAAEFRWQRMALLYERDRRIKADGGRGCFCTSPLEVELFERFTRYIEESRL